MLRCICSYCLILLLCPAMALAANVAANGSVITISGPVDSATIGKVRPLIGATTTTLRIASPGGDPDAMLDLAELVLKHGWTVAVTGICAASCASHVFIAGRRRLIEPDSVVMFQRTSTTDIEVYDAVRDQVPAVWKDLARRRAVREAELLRARGVSLHVTRDFLWSTNPICIGLIQGFGGQIQQQFVSVYSAWVPDRQYMEANNLHFSGFWPQSQREVEKLLVKWAGPNARLVRYGELDHRVDPRPAGDASFGPCPKKAN